MKKIKKSFLTKLTEAGPLMQKAKKILALKFDSEHACGCQSDGGDE